nr:hypothetical protein [Tanacetum cinerariifolium]
MIAYLSKSDASAGFDQIVDFLNAHVIQYALVVNPTIYVSCIKQFWASATIKKVNDVVQLHALIDGKKVVVIEDVIRRDLHLEDADEVECLLNEEIFAELARMGYKKPPPKVGKGFFRVETPLFSSMMVQSQPQAVKVKEEVEVPTTPTPPSPINAPSPVPQDPTPTPYASPSLPPQVQPTETSESSIPLLNTLLETYATLSQKVVELEKDKHTQALEIIKLKKRVTKLEKKKSMTSGLKRLRKVTMTMAQKLIKMKAEKAKLLDEQMAQRKYQSLKKKPVSIAQARKNMIIYLKNMVGYKMEHFRGMTYDKVRPIFEKKYKKVQTLFKPDKDVEEPTKKRVTEGTPLQESFKKLKAVEVSGSESTQETPTNDLKEMSEEDIIRVGGIIEAYQSFEDMLKGFDIEDLVALWRLVKEKFSSAVHNVDKEKDLWVELKRLFEPVADDVL